MPARTRILFAEFFLAPALALCFLAVPASALDVRDGGLALCVGINNYANLENIPSPANDARLVADALERTGGFRRVLVLSDAAAAEPRLLATRKNILDTLALLANNATREDGLVFFFSGHGLSDGGKAYLMPLDAEPTAVVDPDAGIPLDDIVAVMAKSRARSKLLLVDASSDAEIFDGVGGTVAAPAGDFAVIVSCDAGQRTLVDEGRNAGLFAVALERALAGAADIDENQDIGAAELWVFLKRFMDDYCLEYLLPPQNPQLGSSAPELAMIRGTNLLPPDKLPAPETPDAAAAEPAREPEPETPAEPEVAEAPAAEEDGDEAEAADGGEATEENLRERVKAALALREAGRPEEAFTALMELTGYGFPEAEFQVGEAYYFGRGVAHSYQSAEQWFIRAGDLGHARAQEMLGTMYWNGIGVAQDHRKAAKWSTLKGRVPDDASPVITKKGALPRPVAAVAASPETAPEPQPAATTATTTTTTPQYQPYQQRQYQQPYQPQPYQQQQQQRSYQGESTGLKLRRYFFGY